MVGYRTQMFDMLTGAIGNAMGLQLTPTAILGAVVGAYTGCGSLVECGVKAAASHFAVDMVK